MNNIILYYFQNTQFVLDYDHISNLTIIFRCNPLMFLFEATDYIVFMSVVVCKGYNELNNKINC